MIYDLKLLKDYIEGNDIENIEELEDNLTFMKNVIRYTQDKKMIHFCSDRLKNDYEFIKFIVNYFKNDLEFICKIADEFLAKNKDKSNFIELNIIMSKLTFKSEYCRKYAMFSRMIFEGKLINAQMKSRLYEYNIPNEGFTFIFDEFCDSKIILNFFAEQFIYQITDKINIESLVHRNFKSFDDLKQYGINNYMIKLISKYDEFLSEYLCSNLECLNNLHKKIEELEEKWELYEQSIYEEMFDKVFQECSLPDSPFSYMEILCYFSKKYNFLDVLKSCFDMSDEIIKFNLDLFAVDENNLLELSYFNRIKKIVLNALKYSQTDDYCEDDIKQPNKEKIIKFIPKKSKLD